MLLHVNTFCKVFKCRVILGTDFFTPVPIYEFISYVSINSSLHMVLAFNIIP